MEKEAEKEEKNKRCFVTSLLGRVPILGLHSDDLGARCLFLLDDRRIVRAVRKDGLVIVILILALLPLFEIK